MIFKRKGQDSDQETDGAESLESAVRAELNDADDATVGIVSAIAGLMAGIAYADREVADSEIAFVHRELSRVEGIDARGASAICAVLTHHVVEISTTWRSRYTRTLKELADRDLRLVVLGLLMDLAAADGTVSHSEVQTLRQITAALGLSQAEYNALQDEHRDKLAALR
jgi:uncharacterized tellurite resistance protein B-like protein